MCGFIGYSVREQNKTDFLDKKFNKFLLEMQHRGPDFSDQISFKKNQRLSKYGFCRLSIQDLDKKANKIFYNEKFCILFNGEIYNVKDLKAKYFPNKTFETKTDTELLFHLIVKYNFEKINEIEGIFSIAFINFNENKVSLIRDYTGTKPLYYTFENNCIYFSSEAWFLYSLSKKKLDIDSTNFYFRYGFAPKKKTLIQNVLKVDSNTILHFYLNQNKREDFKIIKNLGFLNEHNFNNSNFLKKNVENIIEKNLIGNRKVGVYLSGGIDSTIIALVTKEINDKIEAFTSIYENSQKKDNEDYEITKKICKNYSIKLHTSVIKEKDMLDGNEFLKASKFFDEPIANLNFFSSYKQSEMAKMNNTSVILTGDGADEIFGGYRKYQTLKLAKSLSVFSFINNKLKIYKNLKDNEVPYHFYKKLSDKFFHQIFKKEFLENLIKSKNHLYNIEQNKNKISLLNHFDFNYWLTEEHNSKLDKATMANSVEGRVPFQDINILRGFNHNNTDENFSLFKNKINLRNAFKNLPNYVLKRKKRGWFLPERDFLNDFLKKNIFEIFSIQNSQTNFMFNYKKIYEIYFTQGINKFPRYEFITILMFEIWYQKMLDC